jgi:hypothetical protein
MQLGIFGVGRSGTTALYAGVQNLILSSGSNCRYLYEPYLWSHKVFDQPFSEVKGKFGSTSSLSIDGMYTHLKTPLFTDQKSDVHTQFLSLITQDSPNFLLKAIRGNGRLALFLEQFPELRIVYIIRNPLETINSVIDLFSFFGDEFHPSDKPRFLEEIKREFAASFDSNSIETLDEVEWSLLWWRYMNLAALKTISEHRDRVLVVAQEAFKANPEYTLKKIGQFFGLDTQPLSSYESQHPVGPVTSKIHLNIEHINLISSQDSEYWQNFISYSDIPLGKTESELREELYVHYQRNAASNPTAQSLLIPTDLRGISVRRELLRLRRDNQNLLSKLIEQNVSSKDASFCAKDIEDEWEHDRFKWIKAMF